MEMIVLTILVLIIALGAYASFKISLGVYIKTYCRKSTQEKMLALTFDDGPHPEHTPRVLDVLKQYHVKATFFIIGERITGNEEIVKRIHADGHQTGNHSFTHKKTFPLLGAKKMTADLLQCEQTLNRITGCRSKWFRPPFGITNPNVAKAVKMRGYQVAGWSIRSLDTIIQDREKVIRRVVSRLSSGCVVLLHDHLPDTSYILEQIIQHAIKKSYVFVTIEQLFDE